MSEPLSLEEWFLDTNDMLNKCGAHEGHTLRQVGRCILCSCGKRVQGFLPKLRKGQRKK